MVCNSGGYPVIRNWLAGARQNAKFYSQGSWIFSIFLFMTIDTLAETLLEKLRWIAQAETVIGKPIQAGSATVIPVSRVSLGFGIGGRTNKGESSASGGGASVDPVAFLVINGEDVRIVPIQKDNSIVAKVADLVPDIVSSFKKNDF